MLCPHVPLNLYEINTRIWLRELGVSRLRDVPDAELDAIAAHGFSLVWLMGVWEPSAHGEAIAKVHPDLAADYRRALTDLEDADVVASPYAIVGYRASARLGGPADLEDMRARLLRRGIRLILDFVPNHTARDHWLVEARPEIYVGADERAPAAETFVAPGGRRLFCGRDPYFPPWTDTAQLDYRRAGTRRAMIDELREVARQCDGVRCDMAMLLLSDIFARTWERDGVVSPPPDDRAGGDFWPEAIDAVRRDRPDFLFMAEAYWGTERRLQQLGFDYTYDKTLYDELMAGRAEGVVAHLAEGRGRQRRSVRFLENHDEERAAHRLSIDLHRAAALIAMTLPGARLFHHGQLEGARRKVPVQLARRPVEAEDPILAPFYRELLAILRDPVLQAGSFRLLAAERAWRDNPTHSAFVVVGWDGSRLGRASDGSHRVMVANLGAHRAQCRVRLGLPGIVGRRITVSELFGAGDTPVGDGVGADGRPIYLRSGDEIVNEGLFIDLPPRTAQLLRLSSY
jgi:glycosidase